MSIEVTDDDSETFDSEKEYNLDFTRPRVVLCVGRPGKGKTNATKWMIYKNSIDDRSKIFQFGIVFTRLKYDYDYLPEEHVHEGGYDENVLSQYLEGIRYHRDKTNEIIPNFVVFDDMIGLLSKHDPFLINFFATHRHYGTSIFLNTQHLNTGANTTLREITNYALLFGSKQFNTLRSLYENFGQMFESFEEFKEHYAKVTAEPYTAMLYISDEEELTENYLQIKCPDVSDLKYKLKY